MSYARVAQDESDTEDHNEDHVVEVHEDTRTLADVDADRSIDQSITYPIKYPAKPLSPSNNQRIDLSISQSDNLMISLTFIQQNEPNRKVLCNPNWTIGELKSQVFPDAVKEGKLIRLIYLGRVLQDQATLKSLEIEQDHVIHTMISDKIPTAAPVAAPSRESNSSPVSDFYNNTRAPQFIHTSPNAENNDDIDSDIDINDERYITAHASDGQYLFTLPPEGTNRDFVWGFVLGLVLGFLALLWLWNSAAPRKQRLGILLGLMCYVVISSLSGAAQQSHVPHSNP